MSSVQSCHSKATLFYRKFNQRAVLYILPWHDIIFMWLSSQIGAKISNVSGDLYGFSIDDIIGNSCGLSEGFLGASLLSSTVRLPTATASTF